MDYVIIYFYNVYGGLEISHGKYATVVGKFSALFMEGSESLPVVLPGEQKRNFTHIDAIVTGIIISATYGQGDGYGIGSDEAFSINELADMFKLKKEYLPERKGNRMSAPVKTEKLKSLGWSAKRSLEKYIEKIVGQKWVIIQEKKSGQLKSIFWGSYGIFSIYHFLYTKLLFFYRYIFWII